jgi:hypothetical protein
MITGAAQSTVITQCMHANPYTHTRATAEAE